MDWSCHLMSSCLELVPCQLAPRFFALSERAEQPKAWDEHCEVSRPQTAGLGGESPPESECTYNQALTNQGVSAGASKCDTASGGKGDSGYKADPPLTAHVTLTASVARLRWNGSGLLGASNSVFHHVRPVSAAWKVHPLQ